MKKTVLSVFIFCVLLFSVFASSCDINSDSEEFIAEEVISEAVSESINFAIHYIDVGQADAALVVCEGKAMLIDGGNVDDSRLIYTYLKDNNINYLEYIVATHVHEDHMGGISGALNYSDVGTVFCNTAEHDSELFRIFKKQVEKAGKSIVVPDEGDTFYLGSAQVDVISRAESENENDASIVLRIVYGNTSFLFTGDIEAQTEDLILKSGTDIKSTVLKVSHHGSDDSTSYPFLLAADPDYAVISVGKNNEYGHPSENVLKRLKNADVEYYRTDVRGNIICSSDGENVSFSFYKNANAEKTYEEDDKVDENYVIIADGKQVTYVGNKNSKKLHLPSCDSVTDTKEKNREYFFGERSEAIDSGYTPCGSCKP